jgi:hypothetical protein
MGGQQRLAVHAVLDSQQQFLDLIPAGISRQQRERHPST